MGADEERGRGVGRRLGMGEKGGRGRGGVQEDPREWPLCTVGWGGRGVVLTDRMTGGDLTHFLFIFGTKLAVQAMSHAVLGSWPVG